MLLSASPLSPTQWPYLRCTTKIWMKSMEAHPAGTNIHHGHRTIIKHRWNLYNNRGRRKKKNQPPTRIQIYRTQIEGRAARCEQISAVSVSKPNPTVGSLSRTLSITHRVRRQLASKSSVTAVCFLLFLWDPVLQRRLEASWQLVLIHFTITQSWRMALNWQ